MDIQILVQSCFYFMACAAGLVISVVTAMAKGDFGAKCPVYTTITPKSAGHFEYKPGSQSSCNFVLYGSVFCCVLYGFVTGLYFASATHKSKKDPTRGRDMWVMLFLITNTVASAVTFVAACILSVGLKKLCDEFLDEVKKRYPYSYKNYNCADIGRYNWYYHGHEGGTFQPKLTYSLLNIAMYTSWVLLFVWLVQIGLTVFRGWRNRKIPKTDSDLRQIAKQEPTA